MLARPDLDEVSTEELSELQRSMAFYCKRAVRSTGSPQEDARHVLGLKLAVRLLLDSKGLQSALEAVVPSFKHSTSDAGSSTSSTSTGLSGTDQTRYSWLLKLLDTWLLVRGTGVVPAQPEGTCLALLRRLFKGITSFCQLPVVSSQSSRRLNDASVLHCLTCII